MQSIAIVCAAVSAEILIIAFICAFNGIPVLWVKMHQRGFTLTAFTLSFAMGLIAGIFFTMEAGKTALIHYGLTFFPGLFLFIKVIGQFAGWNAGEQKAVVMHAEDYTLAAIMDNLSVDSSLYQVSRLADWKEGPVCFTGAAPAEPVDILAFGAMKDGVFLCSSYEMLQKKKKTKKEVIEGIHTFILMCAGLGMVFPMIAAVYWRMENGVSEDNPYMQYVALLIGILIFGGSRKMTRNPADGFTKFWYMVWNVMYYIVLVEAIMLPFL